MCKSGQTRYSTKGLTFTLLACGYTRMTDLNAFLHHWYKNGLYPLPLWNPVLRKVVVSKTRRHNGRGVVQLHSFLTLAIKWRSVVNSTPWPLYPQRRISPYPFNKRLGGLAACSIVTIAHSFTQNGQWTKTSNQHTLQSCMYNVLCT